MERLGLRLPLRAILLAAAAMGAVPASASPSGEEDGARGARSEAGEAAGKAPDTAGVEKQYDDAGWIYLVDAQEEYRLRHATSPALPDPTAEPVEAETDQDLRFSLTAGAYESQDRFSAQLSSALWADLDGSVPRGEPSAMASVYDLSSPYIWFDVYELWAEYQPGGVLGAARAGRQTTQYGLPATFDGASLRVGVIRRYLDLFLFGGRTVHFFELDAGLFEDWMASAGTVIRPTRDLRLELDYRFTYEDTVIASGLDDHSYGVTAGYRNGEWLRLRGYLRGLDERLSHAGAAVSLTSTGAELGTDLGVDAQTASLSEVNESEDPYFSILGASRPNVRPRAEVWKEFTTGFGVYGVHAGWNARVLAQGEPSPFNRDYGRFYVLAQAADIAVAGPFVECVLEYHYGPTGGSVGGDGMLTVGGSAGYDVDELRAEAGSQYQRLRYDYFVDVEERQDVRSFFVGVRYRPMRWLSIRARYEYEIFDRDLHTFTLTLGQLY